MYFVSHALATTEKNHLVTEKVAFALVYANRKLRPYFDAHKAMMLSS